jgi:DNA-binding HxlR family transcriptional regulator
VVILIENEDKTCTIEKVYNNPDLKNCPIELTFKIIGKKWSPLILRDMFRGITQFNRLLENNEGLTPKVLTQRMRELQKGGIIRRTVITESPIRVKYELTDLGKQLEPVLLAAGTFSMKHLPKAVFKHGKAPKLEEILVQ